MAEKKSVGHAYNVDFLNVVFAASSLFLFLSVIWMVWDDFDREWKNTQRRFAALEYQVTQATLAQAGRAVDKGKLAQLTASEAAAQKNVSANQQKVDELQAKLKDADNALFRATTAFQTMKATYDQDRYDFEASRANGLSSAPKKGEVAADEAKQLSVLDLAREKAEADKADVQKQLGQYTGQVATIQKSIDEINAEQTRLSKRLDVIAPSAVKDYFRNAPLLDFLAPTLKVQQIILPNVVDDVNFIRVPKMDRCQTCHLAIDKKGYEKYPQPFTTHPDLATYLGGSSSHPIDKTGCTVCHEGMGQSVSFRDAAHMPSNEKQKEEWEKKYGWEQPHLWDYPMLPLAMTEASCAKCHKQQVYIPKADKLNIAYATYERAGCFACHKTKGFEDVKKPGPILTKIDSKLIAGLGQELDPQSEGGEADHLDAALLLQLEQQRTRRCAAQRGGDQRDRRVPVRERGEARRSPSRIPATATRRTASRSSRRSAARAVTSSAKDRDRRSVRAGPSASRSRTSATRPPTSGSTTGCGIRSTTARRPTCRTCASPTRRSPTSRPTW